MMAKRILKDHKGVHMRVKGSLGSSAKKKNNNIKSGKFKKKNMRENSKLSDSFTPFRPLKKECLVHLRKKESTHHIFIVECVMMD